MSDKVLVTKSKLVDVADAIREKAGTQAEMTIDEMATAVENLPSGGGSDYIGLEYVMGTTGSPPVDEVIWHGGGTLVNRCFSGLFSGSAKNTPISFPDHPTAVDYSAFFDARVKIDWESLGAELTAIGASALRVSYQEDCSSQVVRLPKFDGLNHNGMNAQACFGYMGAKAPSTYYFDVMQNIPRNIFQNCSHPNMSISFGSIGHAVQSAGLLPFQNCTAAAVVSVVIYTTGEYLDSIKTAVSSVGSGSFTFTYKASEATTYDGVDYSAGDTILVDQINTATASSTVDLMNASDEEFAAAGRILMGVEQ